MTLAAATAVRTVRPFNFSAGPAVLPEPVLERAAAEMLDWHGSGMSVMEMSHRGREFGDIATRAERDLRTLLGVPQDVRILFMQGGGLAQNAIVPLNLSEGGAVDFVVTGAWSAKSAAEARRYCDVHVAASNLADGPANHTTLPDPSGWALRPEARYVHVCGNETIHGVEFPNWPELHKLGCEAPLVVDCSSQVLSRPIDWAGVGLAFAGAQKNIGPAGLTLVFVRDDLVGRALPACPSAFDYKQVANNASMFNTPPTYAIYIAGLVFEWLLQQGGVPEMERRAIEKARLLYDAIDGSGIYVNHVQPSCRSRMNVPFFIRDERLHDPFLAGARAAGLLQLKGHKTVGGLRASLYNAMPLAGVQALVAYMQEFARRHG